MCSALSIFNTPFITKNQQIHTSLLEEKQVTLFIKREDLINPFISGNKFRKLKYNIQQAQREHKQSLLTFGGAYSNHILATAAAGKLAKINTIGVIRGEELGASLKQTLLTNTTLQKAHQYGMRFVFISRTAYRQKHNLSFIKKLKEKYGDFYLIPEGGTNALAVKGCEEILTEKDTKFNYICTAVGTGGTISGLINSAKPHQKIIGFAALKGNFLTSEIEKYTINNANWTLEKEYHFGGYAKYNEVLISFINQFKEQTNILLDPIYTGKMLFGILDKIQKNQFPKGSKILAIHTGGLQGIEGVNKQLQKKNKQLINN